MKNRDLHALAQFALYIKAVRGFDVFEVDSAESRLQGGNHLDQLDRVWLVDFDVKHIHAGKLLEQDSFALHHRFGGEWADVAQAQHGGAIGDDGHQVAAAGVFVSCVRVFDDFFARGGHTRRVGQRQVALVDQLLGGRYGHFAGGWKLVVFECGAAQFVALFLLLVYRRIGHVKRLQRGQPSRASITCKKR